MTAVQYNGGKDKVAKLDTYYPLIKFLSMVTFSVVVQMTMSRSFD